MKESSSSQTFWLHSPFYLLTYRSWPTPDAQHIKKESHLHGATNTSSHQQSILTSLYFAYWFLHTLVHNSVHVTLNLNQVVLVPKPKHHLHLHMSLCLIMLSGTPGLNIFLDCMMTWKHVGFRSEDKHDWLLYVMKYEEASETRRLSKSKTICHEEGKILKSFCCCSLTTLKAT